jgi:hypothetical protein
MQVLTKLVYEHVGYDLYIWKNGKNQRIKNKDIKSKKFMNTHFRMLEIGQAGSEGKSSRWFINNLWRYRLLETNQIQLSLILFFNDNNISEEGIKAFGRSED